MSQQYNIYVFNTLPYSETNPTPVASLLSSDVAKFPAVFHFPTPEPSIECATGLGSNCGKKGCTECPVSTMKAASPDYDIFKTVTTHRSTLGNPNIGVVILKASTVTTSANSVPFANALTDAETASSGKLDIFFFARWLDRPDLYDVLLTNSTNGTKVVRTFDAHGIQALALTPQGISKLTNAYDPIHNPVTCRPFSQVINTLLKTGGLWGASTTPPLAHYDATLIVSGGPPVTNANIGPETRHSYLKLSEARGSTFPERPFNRRISGDLGLFWSIIIMIVAFITAWVLLRIGAAYNANSHDL